MKNNAKNEREKVTLSTPELVSKLRDWNQRLCKSHGNDWALSIPARPNIDPDFLIEETCERLEKAEKQKDELVLALESIIPHISDTMKEKGTAKQLLTKIK